MANDAWLVVGLGNPGDRYASTRHNVGHMALDVLAARMGARFRRHPRANAQVADGRLRPGGPRLILATSLGYMNTSGGPVSQLAAYSGIPADRVIVLHDDLDLPFDTLRLKLGGGHGGHNGLRDIIAALGDPGFLRVRIGIGRPPGRQDAADFVLKPFGTAERETLGVLLEEAADAVTQIVDDGLAAAQQRVHSKD